MKNRFRQVAVVFTTAMGLAAVASSDASSRPVYGSGQGTDTITRRYDVRLGTTGYTGLIENAQCKAITDAAGYDSLIGTVQGVESTRPNQEPVLYTGVLQRKTKMDYCLVGANDTWCVLKLTGEARMNVEIELREDALGGAYVKADSAGPATSESVVGNCAQQDKSDVLDAFPDGESGGSPSGQEIDETPGNTFTVNGIRRFRVGTFPSTEAARGGWGMRITRAQP